MNEKFQITGGSGPRKIIRFVKKTKAEAVPIKTDHDYTYKTEHTKIGTSTTDSGKLKPLRLEIPPKIVMTEETKVIIKEENTASPPNLCRTCLQIGDISIYGNDSHNDISEDLKTICAVNIKNDDAFSKYICHSCHFMLQGAIQLRITAQYSEQVLLEQADITTEDNIDFNDRGPDNNNTVLEEIELSMSIKDKPSQATLQYTSNEKKGNFENIKSLCHSIPPDVKVTLVSKKSVHTDKKIHVVDMADKENNVTMKLDITAEDNIDFVNREPDINKCLEKFELVMLKKDKPKATLQYTSNKEKGNFANIKSVCHSIPPDVKVTLISKKSLHTDKKTDVADMADKELNVIMKHIAADSLNNLLPTTDTNLSNIFQHSANSTSRKPIPKLQKLMKISPLTDNKKIIKFNSQHNVIKSKSPLRRIKYSSISIICHFCGKEFTNKCAAYQHKRKHCNRTPSLFSHKCSFCPYRCRDAHTLTLHTRTHTGDKPYQCSQCAKQFATSSNMYRHIMTNHKTREITCNICNATFWRKKEMEQHIKKVHYGEKPHQCDSCGKCFGDRKTMHKHQKQVHKREKCAHNVTPLYLRPEFQEIVQNASANDGQLQGSGPNECYKTTN